ncbi:hypothetical protein HNY42_15915 (plasmid) [Exiguobacterium sp. Helios]|uniref:hypothetical protein n=1 Tax=Exiguobacterium sp. Helios TaxID=2735868 RepID=UPI00165E6201|nr:hypothetical protein [Exiguobacterium sp. Helios]QNR22485.1 hypothetical protein HNY42_15915 [Exiguobacterium sp. Helios]
MNIIKGNINDHFKFILVLVAVFLLGVVIIFNLSKSDSKFFFESMKFIFSFIAAYVGIRAVVNSSRSAALSAESVRIATESIEFNKNKEKTDQSSHLIAFSLISRIKFNVPNYVEKPIISLGKSFDYRSKYLNSMIVYIRNKRFNIYKSNEFPYSLEIFNSGKGAAINLEYTFSYVNLTEFKDYYFKTTKALISHDFPGYSFELIQKENIDLIRIKDFEIQNRLDDMKMELIKYDEEDEFYEAYKEMKDSAVFEYAIHNFIPEYKDIIKSQDSVNFNIPTEFTILCNHYINVQRMAQELRIHKNKDFDMEIFNIIKNLPIPTAVIKIRYYDESLIRSGQYNFDKRNELQYNVKLKNNFDSNFVTKDFYLEVNLSQPEITNKNYEM